MDQIEDSPPRRSGAQLEEWVQEFREQGHLFAGRLKVVEQEDADSQDTGLVVMSLMNAKASIYMQPKGYDQPLWEATLTGRPEDLTLSPHDMASLAAELVVAGNLCSFLQWKSLEWDRESGTHARSSAS
ncbi:MULTISPECIES: hypothetical protein [unclassified Microbacterium]|jgi:hypothetical protein|uniref:hypothetical protein n=1 Tax=unclassified Microbacterium TaxID=2609290 RepID=UPI0006F5082B|nr:MULTISPECIES: hypothetical protein [unclassified Microbacterium]KQR86455.1 hypothetical protein ASF96_08785 [Microbacterium sp. Leaf179]KQT71872.1 hypothetical protein ASG45_12780 [Microbacterium sp. Leaf436]MBD8478893.1 hypothetical protein [Microbacterium sp. CFBP 8794]